MRRSLARSATALLALATPGLALGGAQRPVDDPAVFPGAAVSSFVLPYRYEGTAPTPERVRAGREISALVHLEILFSMLKYGAVGGTDLVAKGNEPYDVDEVIGKVAYGSGPGALRPGQTLVVTWGRLFEQGDDLYVQSYVRFFRRGSQGPEAETLKLKLEGTGTSLELTGTLPAQSVAFPPRRIGKSDLAKVGEEFRRAMAVRPQPDLNAKGTSIDFDPDRMFPYGVTKTEGDWMWIEPFDRGPRGWVRARLGGSPGEWSLVRWLPELSYIDAVCGFMRLAAGNVGVDAERRALIESSIADGFSRFEAAVPADSAPKAEGLARAILGFLAWRKDPTPAGRAAAASLFAEARERMPDYAAALNLAAVSQPLRTGQAFDAKAADRLGRELLGALALDPSDRTVLGNLDHLYRLFAARPDWSPFPPEALSERLKVVRAGR